jgi:hypothetical protein
MTTPPEKILPVHAVFKNRFAFYSPDDDMVQGTGGIYAGSTGHNSCVSGRFHYVNRSTSPISYNPLLPLNVMRETQITHCLGMFNQIQKCRTHE